MHTAKFLRPVDIRYQSLLLSFKILVRFYKELWRGGIVMLIRRFTYHLWLHQGFQYKTHKPSGLRMDVIIDHFIGHVQVCKHPGNVHLAPQGLAVWVQLIDTVYKD